MNERDCRSPSALRVALAGAWQVVRARRLRHFPRVLALLEAVGRAAPAALSFQHSVRLRLGLQAAAVHSLLLEDHSEAQLFDSIDLFFPEGTAPNWGVAAPPHEQQMAAEAQQDFRDSILPLLWDRRKRCQYLQGPARHAYGAAFLRALEQLCFEFLQRLESALPPPDLSQLYAVVWSHAPSGPRPPSLPILHRYLADMGHAPSGAVPRPLSSAQQQKGHSECSTPTKPRPQRRQLRPLRVQPLEFLGESEGESGLQRKLRSAPRRRSPPGEFPFPSFLPRIPFFQPPNRPVRPPPRRGPNGTFQRGGAEL